MVAPQQLLAVAVHFQGHAGDRIHFLGEDAAGVGAVDHPQPPVRVVEYAGVHGVGVPGRLVDAVEAVHLVRARAGVQEQPLVLIGPRRSIRHRHANTGLGLAALAVAVVHMVFAVLEPDHVGGPESVAAAPGEGVRHHLVHVGDHLAVGLHPVVDVLPVHQVAGLGHRQMGAEDIPVSVLPLDNGRVVDGHIGESMLHRRIALQLLPLAAGRDQQGQQAAEGDGSCSARHTSHRGRAWPGRNECIIPPRRPGCKCHFRF